MTDDDEKAKVKVFNVSFFFEITTKQWITEWLRNCSIVIVLELTKTVSKEFKNQILSFELSKCFLVCTTIIYYYTIYILIIYIYSN